MHVETVSIQDASATLLKAPSPVMAFTVDYMNYYMYSQNTQAAEKHEIYCGKGLFLSRFRMPTLIVGKIPRRCTCTAAS